MKIQFEYCEAITTIQNVSLFSALQDAEQVSRSEILTKLPLAVIASKTIRTIPQTAFNVALSNFIIIYFIIQGKCCFCFEANFSKIKVKN